MDTVINNTIELFNAVKSQEAVLDDIYVDYEYGFVVRPEASASLGLIKKYIRLQEGLSDRVLTFRDKWKSVDSSLKEIVRNNIQLHLKDVISADSCIPDELLLTIDNVGLTFKIIRGFSTTTLLSKCHAMLNMIDLDDTTIRNVIEIIDAYGDVATYDCVANVLARDILECEYGVLPKRPEDVLRLAIFRATGITKFNNNKVSITLAIRDSGHDPSTLFENYGLYRLSRVFRRFKTYFIAFKNEDNKSIINKLNKLSTFNANSKEHNSLRLILWDPIKDESELTSIPTYMLLTLYQVTEVANNQSVKLHHLRSGKAFVKGAVHNRYDESVTIRNKYMILKVLKKRLAHLQDETILLDKNIEFGLPISSRKYVGNYPEGTRFKNKSYISTIWGSTPDMTSIKTSAIGLDGKAVPEDNDDNVEYSKKFTWDNENINSVNFNGAKEPYMIVNEVTNGKARTTHAVAVDLLGYDTDVKWGPIRGRQTIIGMYLPSEGKKGSEIVLIERRISERLIISKENLASNLALALKEYYDVAPTINTLFDLLEIKYTFNSEETTIDFTNPDREDFIKLFKIK